MTALSLRDAVAGDDAFLRRVYDSTRVEELALVGWDERTRRAFLDQQFSAQAADYRRRFPDARFMVVELDGEPVGRFYVHESDDVVRVLDIAFLPEHRGRGLGASLLADVLEAGKTVALTVARTNRAERLYRRLGFEVVGEDDVYIHMERRA